MYRRFVIFCAEYLVIPVGGIFFYLSLQAPNGIEQLNILVIGGTLLIISLAISKILKRLINKPRPPIETEFFIPHDKYAFPSGHAAGLFSLTVFILTYDIWLGIFSSLFSFIVIIARVKSNVHYTDDIIAGSFLGVVVTWVLLPQISNLVTVYLVPTLLSTIPFFNI